MKLSKAYSKRKDKEIKDLHRVQGKYVQGKCCSICKYKSQIASDLVAYHIYSDKKMKVVMCRPCYQNINTIVNVLQVKRDGKVGVAYDSYLLGIKCLRAISSFGVEEVIRAAKEGKVRSDMFLDIIEKTQMRRVDNFLRAVNTINILPVKRALSK